MRLGKHIVTSTHIARNNTLLQVFGEIQYDATTHTWGKSHIALRIPPQSVGTAVLHIEGVSGKHTRSKRHLTLGCSSMLLVDLPPAPDPGASKPPQGDHEQLTAPTTASRREVAAVAVAAHRHPPSRQRCPALLARAMVRFLRGQEIGLRRSWIPRAAFRRT